MFKRLQPSVKALWWRFRRLPPFIQLLLVFPAVCAIALTFVVGNMGLALLGTAVAINPLIAGWFGGASILILGKAGLIVTRDRRRQH